MISNLYKLILLTVVLNTPCYAFDTITFDKASALFSATDKTVPVITAQYVSWAENWQWSYVNISAHHNGQAPNYTGASFSANIQNLGVGFSGSTHLSNQEVRWTYQWHKSQNRPDTKGIGIEFGLNLTSSTFENVTTNPVLLANKTGWTWTTPSGQTVEVTFSPALADLYFEQGYKGKIRAMFFTGIAQGVQSTTMTVKTSQAVAFTAPIDTKYAPANAATWHKNILPTNTSPVDLSFLNENDLPAGKHGFVVTNKDQLEFEDGTPAKFWGTNVQAYALFSSTDEEIKRHAKRIAKFGYNLVRIHHHDSYWVAPNIFKNQKDNTIELSEASLKKIDWWVKCLKDEGVYLWIDLQTGRQYTENDGITDFADFATKSLYTDALGFSYYSSDIVSFMDDFDHAYLSRIDTYKLPANSPTAGSEPSQQTPPYNNAEITALTQAFNNRYFSLSLDPQRIVNETPDASDKEKNSTSDDIKSLINSFRSPYQPENIKDPEAASTAKVYSDTRGFNYYNDSIQVLMKAFNQAYLSHVNQYTQLALKDDPSVISILLANENDLTHHFGNALLADKNVPIHNAIFSHDAEVFAKTHDLSKDDVVKTWLMGESKLYLNDVEHRFNQTMMSHLEDLDVKPLVVPGNIWAGMGLFSLPSLTDGPLIDAHSFGRADELNFNPRYNPGFLTWLGAAQVSGKPLSVTEWNIQPFTAKDRFTAPLYTASIASLQGWDSVMYYGYSQDNNWSTLGAARFSSFNDPSVLGLMPAAALLYRQGHVAKSNTTYELQLNRDDFFFVRQDPTSSKTIRTLMETSRFTVGLPDTDELPWLTDNITPPESGTVVITDANQDFIPANQNFVESDTQELKRDWGKGIHTINTEKSQIVSGWVGGESIDLDDVSFEITTNNAVVAVQSLENKAINASRKIFITLMAQSQPATGTALPFISEPVTGQLEIYAPEGLKLYPIDKNGNLSNKINIPYDSNEDKYTIALSAATHAHWYLLQDEVIPEFKFTLPSNGATFNEGDLITIKTNTTELGKAIKSVNFSYDNNIAIGFISDAPYEVSTRDLPAGNHTLHGHIVFEDNTIEDFQVSITVEASVFEITLPLNNTRFIKGQPITIETNAVKWAGSAAKIKEVIFWKDAFLYLDKKLTAPYNITISSDSFSLGDHILRARVLLNNGAFKSAQISINVIDDIERPAFTITHPVNNAKFIKGKPMTIKTNALLSVSDAKDIQKVLFWKDNFSSLGVKTTPPYEIILPNNSLAVGNHILRARIMLNNGTSTDSNITIKVLPVPVDPANIVPLIMMLFSGVRV